jgi:hypothetical protein
LACALLFLEVVSKSFYFFFRSLCILLFTQNRIGWRAFFTDKPMQEREEMS